MKSSLELSKVVLLGRTLDEYCRYFDLKIEELRGKAILDIASGVGSFCAEGNERGLNVTAFDLIYELSTEEILRRCEPDLDFVTREIAGVNAYNWDFYGSPEGMRVHRERAYRSFLHDYGKAKGERYIFGKLPHTPFRDGQFDLTLISYLLFVYEEQSAFDYSFHKESLLEILRITSGEARIYPLVNFKAERSRIFEALKSDPTFADFIFEEVRTDFEFLKNSNSFVRIRRKATP